MSRPKQPTPRDRKALVEAELAADAVRARESPPPVRRKIDGKYYQLRYITRDNREKEDRVKELREGHYDVPCYVRVFNGRLPGWADEYERYLIYARPRPATPEERASRRKPRKPGSIRGKTYSALFGHPDPVALAKFKRKAPKK